MQPPAFRKASQHRRGQTAGRNYTPYTSRLGTFDVMISIWKRLRLAQIRSCSWIILRMNRIPPLFIIIKALREFPVIRHVFIALVGYNRPFATLEDASASIAGYDQSGHEHPGYVELHLTMAQSLRPSDYPALFHIQPLLPHIRKVFDFGGNAGNLFYSYSNYLKLPSDLVWTVYDLPKNRDAGVRLAKEKNETRLRFTGRLNDAEDADLFIASGSLHYFEKPLPDIIADFRQMPRYVLVNRTPLTDGPPLATVQDAGSWRVACMLYNRDDLIRRFEKVGYETVDTWRATELSLFIPGFPDRSVPAYSGMFFRLARRATGTAGALALIVYMPAIYWLINFGQQFAEPVLVF